MSSLILVSRADWFKHVLDFVGFAPSRFYLRETCRDLAESIPKEVFLSGFDFAEALVHKFGNPDNLFLERIVDVNAVTPILHAYSTLNDLNLEMRLLERSFMFWDPLAVASTAPILLLEDIEWDAWLVGAAHIVEKVAECKRLIDPTNQHPRSCFRYCTKENLKFPVDRGFIERAISDWARPEHGHAWEQVIAHLIANGADMETIEYLRTESGIDLMSIPDALHVFAISGKIELMNEFLNTNFSDRDFGPNYCRLAVRRGVQSGNPSMIRLLVDRFGIFKEICAKWASAKQDNDADVELLDFFLSRGADINANLETGRYSCLDTACLRGHWALADAIVERGGKFSNLRGLFSGPAGSDIDIFRTRVLEKGYLDDYMDTYLINAAFGCCSSIDVVSEIFKLVSVVDPCVVPRMFAESSLMKGLYSGIPFSLPLVKELILNDPTLVHASVDGLSLPIGWCELQQFKDWPERAPNEFAHEFPYYRYFYTRKRPEGETALYLVKDWLLNREALECIVGFKKLLIEYGANPDVWFTKEFLAAYLNRYNHDDPVIKLDTLPELLRHGVDLDGVFLGNTALSQSVKSNNRENAEILLRFGASIFKPDSSIPSAFIAAGGSKRSARMIENFYDIASGMPGFEINALNRCVPFQFGAIHEAAYAGCYVNMSFLLDHGADPHLRSGELEITPLMMAYPDDVGREHATVRQLLIDRGVDINARNSDGRTAFFTYCHTGCEEGCELLIRMGADITIPDNNGVAPIDLVRFICQYVDNFRGEMRARTFILNAHTTANGDTRTYWPNPDAYVTLLEQLESLLGSEPNPLPMSAIDFAKKYDLRSIHSDLTREN